MQVERDVTHVFVGQPTCERLDETQLILMDHLAAGHGGRQLVPEGV